MTVIAAVITYTAAWFILFSKVKQRHAAGLSFKLMIPAAIALHAWSASNSVLTSDGVVLGFFQVASVLFVAMNIIVAMSSIRKPLDNIFLILLPFSCIAIILAGFISTRAPINDSLNVPIIAHILLSVVAYSLLTIATLQAILLNYQNKQLRNHHTKSVLGIFPPLQTMESLLFDLVWAGFILLTLSILSGVQNIEDLFEQQLTHKTAFSLISWVIYATLLIGRHLLGWRGRSATRWVIAGFAALMLAYFGSKFVIEFLLSSP